MTDAPLYTVTPFRRPEVAGDDRRDYEDYIAALGEPLVAQASAPCSISATPFEWIEPHLIPPRAWVYDRHYARKFISATVAPGGVGKSSLTIVEALAISTGRALLDVRPDERTNVWIWNGEDPFEELQRRVIASAKHYELGKANLDGRLFLDSGRTMKIVIAEQTRNGAVIAQPVVEAVVRTIRENDIGVFIVDPFVSSHRVTENDNNAIETVAAAWAEIADETGCAIELVHHSRKTSGTETTVEDARGASALLAKARSARAINGMTKDEAEKADVDNRRLYFRCENGKANLAIPPDKANWFHLRSVDLGNGSAPQASAPDFNGMAAPCRFGDSVGVVTSWRWPDALEGVSAADLLKIQKVVSEGQWRENSQASDWAGKAVADVLKLDVKNKAHKAKIAALLKVWIGNGMFAVVTGEDAKRNKRPFVEVGEWATP